MSARRSPRRRANQHGTATLVLAVAAAALAAYRAGLVLAVALSATAVLLAVAGVYAAHRYRAATVTSRKASREPRPAPRTAPSGGRRHTRPQPAEWTDRVNKPRTPRPGDWTPPRSPRMLAVTEQCAGGQCHACPAPDACEHCDHDPAAFVRRNREAYDRAQASFASANGHDEHDRPPY